MRECPAGIPEAVGLSGVAALSDECTCCDPPASFDDKSFECSGAVEGDAAEVCTSMHFLWYEVGAAMAECRTGWLEGSDSFTEKTTVSNGSVAYPGEFVSE